MEQKTQPQPQTELEKRHAFVLNRAAAGINTPINRAELQELRESMPGQRFFIKTASGPNRQQRRTHLNGTLYNNRALTPGRVMERALDPVYGGKLQPNKQSIRVKLKNLFGRVRAGILEYRLSKFSIPAV